MFRSVPAATERIRESRAVVDRLVNGERLIYGLNTGLGHMRNERVPLDILEATQIVTVRVHSGGIGPPLPPEIVRAAIAVRLAGIARGGSGASPAIADAYVAMLNARRASDRAGDRVGRRVRPDAHGRHRAGRDRRGRGGVRGRTYVRGQRRFAAPASTRSGSRRRTGSTIISANGVSIGHAALRGRSCAAAGGRRGPRRRDVARSHAGESSILQAGGRCGKTRPRAGGRCESHQRAPRRKPALHRRRAVGPGRPVVPRGTPSARGVPRGRRFCGRRCRGRACRHGRQPAGLDRRRSHDQQRQLPSDA